VRRRIPRIRQHDVTDCGAACLLSVATYYGRRVPIARIRQFASTDRQGTNVLGMVEAATKLGFVAKGVRGGPESIGGIPLPAIAHVVLDGALNHYVVIYAVRKDHVLVMEPRDGSVSKVTIESFRAQWTGVLIILSPAEGFEVPRGPAPVTVRFWNLLRPHRAILTQALLGSIAYTMLGLTTAMYIQKVVDHVLVDGNRNLLNLLSVAMVGILLVQTYIGTAKSLLTLGTGQKIDAALMFGYYTHLLSLPQRFFDTMRVGEVISRLGDAIKIRAFVNDTVLELAVSLLVVLFSWGLMIAYSWKLSLVVSAIIPLYAIVLWATNVANRRILRKLMESAADLESHLVETVTAMSSIKRFDLASDAAGRAERRIVRLLRSVEASSKTSIFSARGTEGLSRLAVIVLFWVGSGFVISGELTPGELMGIYALLGYLTGPVTHLIGANRSMQDAMIAADRLFEILDLEVEGDPPHAVDFTPELLGDIRFEGVSFRYGSRRPVLDAIDMTFRKGEMTAIVGESGCGKSTTVGILQRLYPIERGRVSIGGIDLDQITRASLRRQVVAVAQNAHLFAGTLIENIAAGDPKPDLPRLLTVCDRLGITTFVRQLPQGFETLLGENGVELSGGQKQRVALARALYRDAPVLVLDEATSHLDALGERVVYEALRMARSEGKTIVVIAHRLSTIASADRIIVLGDGRVREEGTHEELMALGGTYAAVWESQMGAGRVYTAQAV